jgi:hypothetical protein
MRLPWLAGLILSLWVTGAPAQPARRKLDLKLRETALHGEMLQSCPRAARRDWMQRATERLLAGPLAFMSSIPADRVDALAAGLLGVQSSF